jgi:hypothetical protein
MCEAEGLEDLSPAAKLVFRVLGEIGPATRSEIDDEAMLPGRTTNDAIERLEDLGAVKEVGTGDPTPAYDIVDGGEEA